MKEMNSTIHNNISDLLKLARKFNCFYLTGMFGNCGSFEAYQTQIVKAMEFNIVLVLGLHQGVCKPFVVAGYQVGLIRPDVVKHLQRFPEVSDIPTTLLFDISMSSSVTFPIYCLITSTSIMFVNKLYPLHWCHHAMMELEIKISRPSYKSNNNKIVTYFIFTMQ